MYEAAEEKKTIGATPLLEQVRDTFFALKKQKIVTQRGNPGFAKPRRGKI